MHYPITHLFGAYCFFCTMAIGTSMNTYLSYILCQVAPQTTLRCSEMEKSHYSATPENDDEQTTPATVSVEKLIFKWQLYTVIVFWVAVMLYIPIGSMIRCPATPISVQEVRNNQVASIAISGPYLYLLVVFIQWLW